MYSKNDAHHLLFGDLCGAEHATKKDILYWRIGP